MTVQEVIDAVIAKAGKETTDTGSLVAMIAVLKQAVLDAMASAGTVTPAQEAAVKAVFDGMDANDQAVVDALAQNVPPTP